MHKNNSFHKNKINYIVLSIYIVLSLCTILIDFITKKWIITHIKIYSVYTLFPFFNIFHVDNYGSAFGLFSKKKEIARIFLSLISIIVIIQMIRKIFFNFINKKNQFLTYLLIISGSIGNLIDRIYYGFVIDFIDLHIHKWHFPTFNIADISIFIGFFLFFLNRKKIKK